MVSEFRLYFLSNNYVITYSSSFQETSLVLEIKINEALPCFLLFLGFKGNYFGF